MAARRPQPISGGFTFAHGAESSLPCERDRSVRAARHCEGVAPSGGEHGKRTALIDHLGLRRSVVYFIGNKRGKKVKRMISCTQNEILLERSA